MGKLSLWKRLCRRLCFPIHFFRILRAIFTIWLLDYLTHPEIVPLTVYGSYVSHEGEIAIINHPTGQVEIGKVAQSRAGIDTVYMRLYRRPR